MNFAVNNKSCTFGLCSRAQHSVAVIMLPSRVKYSWYPHSVGIPHFQMIKVKLNTCHDNAVDSLAYQLIIT